MTGVYNLIIKDGIIIKKLNRDSVVGNIINSSLKTPQKYIFFKSQVKSSHKKDFIGKYIVKGKPLQRRGDYYSPLLKGESLNDLDININSPSELFSIIILLLLLLVSLQNYKLKYGTIEGDWALHNIIWTGNNLINIDLEGFYTYSLVGPQLPWVKKENTLSFIKKTFLDLQIEILNNFTLKKKVPYFSIYQIPFKMNYQVFVPYQINQNITDLDKYLFHIDLGELIGYNTITYNVWLTSTNQDKISFTILPISINKHDKFKLLFSFEASLENGYEHPIGIQLIDKFSPRRTILQVVDNEADFYVKKFYQQ